jgi:excisionase family DNA binding protein
LSRKRSNRSVRLALRREEAARALGVSDESFDRYVRGELPVVRVGTLRLYPVEALHAWLRERASAPADDVRNDAR